MKIAYLANIRFPSERAHSVQVFHMAKAFAENGADLDLYINKRSKASKAEIERYYSHIMPFFIKRISHGFFSPQVLISYYFSEFFFALNFYICHQPDSYDLIYSRHEWIVWLLSGFVDQKKLAWESHEAKLTYPAKRLLKKGIKTVVISEGIHDKYTKVGVPESQLLVAYDGIDNSFFGELESKVEARRRLRLEQDQKIALYIGGFDAWKGVETFFAAASQCPGVVFATIGGTAAQVSEYKRKYPAVTFLGSRPYAELKDNQQAADILVIPNTAKTELSAKYTSPLKLFAHMGSGIPLMVANLSSLTNVTGIDLVTLFIPDDAVSLANHMMSVIDNYEKKTQGAQELKNQALAYTWNHRALKIRDFISHG